MIANGIVNVLILVLLLQVDNHAVDRRCFMRRLQAIEMIYKDIGRRRAATPSLPLPLSIPALSAPETAKKNSINFVAGLALLKQYLHNERIANESEATMPLMYCSATKTVDSLANYVAILIGLEVTLDQNQIHFEHKRPLIIKHQRTILSNNPTVQTIVPLSTRNGIQQRRKEWQI